MTLPIAPIAGLAAGLLGAPPGYSRGPIGVLLEERNPVLAGKAIVSNYTGYSIDEGNFTIQRLSVGLVPLIVGCLVHKFVGGAPLNVNRMLGSAGVPLIRI